jgi:hypothetical protein
MLQDHLGLLAGIEEAVLMRVGLPEAHEAREAELARRRGEAEARWRVIVSRVGASGYERGTDRPVAELEGAASAEL